MDNLSSYEINVAYTVYGQDRIKQFYDIEEYNSFVNKGSNIYRPDCFIIFFYDDDTSDVFKDFNFSIALNKIKQYENA